MIATLTGTVAEKLSDIIIIDVRGIGYGTLMPLEDYGKLAVGDPVKAYIYEHIRENMHDLYAFTQTDTKRLFEQLLDVNGVGPKMALNVLGIGSVEDVRRAIASGDTKYIQVATGVGKRVAERIVIELKDKVGLISTADPDALLMGDMAAHNDEAVQALVTLGYSVADALNSLTNIDKSLPTADRVKQALKGSTR
jgi:holliday junction DNA helicase RuvA